MQPEMRARQIQGAHIQQVIATAMRFCQSTGADQPCEGLKAPQDMFL